MSRLKSILDLTRNQLIILSTLLVVFIATGFGLFEMLKKKDLEAKALKFESQSKELVAEIEKEIELDLEVLISLNALYSINDSISREQFKIFNKNILSRISSIQAIEWIPKVTYENKERYIAEARNDGFSDFQITERVDNDLRPVTDRPVYYPVFYIEPLQGNKTALGFDLASDKVRLEALKKASETDDFVATARVTLVQEKSTQYGILVFLSSKKDEELLGYHSGAFRIDDLISNAIGNLNRENTNLVIYDLSANEGKQLLSQFVEDGMPILPDTSNIVEVGALNYVQTIKIADREWYLQFTPTNFFLSDNRGNVLLLMVIFGIFSLGIIYYFLLNFIEIKKRREGEILLENRVKIKTAEIEKSNTELKRALKNISDYKFALDQTDIVLVTDLKGDIEYVNDLFSKISKYSQDELIGQNIRIIDSGYHPIVFWEEMWMTIEKGEVWENEIKNKAKDGSAYWVETTIIPFLNDDGKPERYMGLHHEITDRKLREIELNHYHKKLEQTNKNLERFASMTAHDMKTPLNSAIGLVDLIKMELGENLNGKIAQYISLLKEINEQTKDLINGILEYSKVGFSSLELEQINLDELIKTVSSKYISDNSVINIGGTMPVVRHYKIALMQVIDNILSNAIKYNDKDLCVVNIICNEKPEFYEIAISDNGPGIPEENREIIFDLFENLKNKKKDSTGIGLATVKKMITETNGEIWVESSANNGAKFIFTIEKHD